MCIVMALLLPQPCALECDGGVTALTLPAELADMDIVGCVTRRALGRKFYFVRWLFVAALASYLAMRTR